MRKKPPRGRLNAISYSLMLREFLDGPCSTTEIVEATGFSRKRMSQILGTMHRQGVLHIVEWESLNLRNRAPVYALGEGKDTPRPARISRKVRGQNYRLATTQRAVLGLRPQA
jgi:hypothetical protein